MIRKIATLAVLALTLAGCATASRLDAAGDVHALLVAIRDNDRAAFDARVDRPALKRSIESRLSAEADRANLNDGARAIAALIRPDVFRAAASYYGYKPDQPLPNRVAIAGALRYGPQGQVCATKKKDGPCLLVFNHIDGTWKLSGFEGDLSDLRGKRR